MTSLIRIALHHRMLALLACAALLGVGWRAWTQLPIDAFPEISPTQTKIILKVSGLTPQEMEQRVVRPIEQEMLSIPRKRVLRSVAKYGIADITLDFEEGVDIYWARQQVAERLAGVMADLPAATSGGLAPITTPLSELYMFTVDGPGTSLAERREVLDWVIRPELRTVAGVAEVNALGGEVRTVEVVPQPARLAAFGLGLADLQQALKSHNSNDGAGRIGDGEDALVVRVEGAIAQASDVAAIGLTAPATGRRLRLDDVAEVREGSLTRYGAVTQNGDGEAVQGLVLGLRGVNARQLTQALEARVAQLQDRLPKGMRITPFYNRAELVQRAIDTVLRALAEAAVLVCVVLVVFLGGLRAAVVVALSLPLCLMATIILMQQLGLTANLMSLGGLAIALGMLVDAAVVVVENIEAQLEERAPEDGQAAPPLSASEMQALVLRAVGEVVQPVVAGVLIICVVFLPLLTLQDLEGKLFSPVALTIVLALLSSLAVALLLVPSLAALLLRSTQPAHRHGGVMARLESAYARSRDALWRYPRALAVGSLVLLAATVALYGTLGKTFLPTLDEGDILLQLQKSPSVSLQASAELDTRVQQAILQQVPEVKAIVARLGSDELGLDPMGLNETDTFLVLKPREEWRGDKDDIVTALRGVMEGFPGLVFGFTQPIEMRISEMLTGTRGDVAVKIFGQDLLDVQEAAQKVSAAMEGLSGAAEVIAPPSEGLSYLQLRIDRTRAAQAGISVEVIQQALRQAVDGETVGHVLQGAVRVPVQLRGPEGLRTHAEALQRLPLVAPDGRVWPLSALVETRTEAGPIRIDHEQGRRLATIQVSVEGRALDAFVRDAQAAVAALQLSPDLQVVWGGQFENQERAAQRLALVIPGALVVIFIILSLTFGSAVQALMILLNVPFALVGGVMALAISGEYLSVPASVGFVALLGIAVLNGVVMVSHFNARLAQGEALDAVVREGSLRRLRPVLMTAVITGLGMVPLLFASGPGSEIQRPLAIVVSGGLVTATVLTLYLLPLMFGRWGAPRSAQAASVQGMAVALAALALTAGGTLWPAASALAQTAPASVAAAEEPGQAWLSLLPPTALVRPTILEAPEVQAARLRLQAQRGRAQAEALGGAETTVRVGQQVRRSPATTERWQEQSLGVERPWRFEATRNADQAQARSLERVGAGEYGEVLWSTGRDILDLWLQAMASAWEAQSARAEAADAQRLWQQTRRRHELGDASRLDESLAEAERDRTQAMALQAQAAAERSQRLLQRRFAVLVPALPPATRLPDAAAWQRFLQPLPVTEAADFLQQALRLQPGLQLLAAQVERAQAVARRLALDHQRPVPTLGMAVSRERNGAEQVVGLSLSLPLPGAARSLQSEAAVRDADAAQASLEAARQRFSAEFEARLGAWERQREAALSQWQAALAQEAVAQRTGRGLALGELGAAEWTAAQRQAREQRRLALQLSMEVLRARAEWSLEAGMLWDLPALQPTDYQGMTPPR